MAYTNCLTLRTVKGSALTHAELDNNFICLDTAISNVVSNVGSNFLPLSGGTLTGPLTACTGGVYVNDLFACDPNTGINVNGSVTIFGNITVWGSATTFNTQIINTESNIIILNASGTTASAQGGGIVVHEGIGPGQDASIILSGSCWTFDPPLCLPPIVDTYVTGFTYSNNVITLSQNLGQPDLSITIDTMTGLTINGSFSASTYLGLPIDVYVTGGTYSNGVVTFTNNTGGTFNVDGFFTGGTGSCITDLYVTNIHGCSPITFWDNIQTNTSTAVGLYGISFGSKNINNSNYTSILGGESNTISNTSPYSSIVGGINNTITNFSNNTSILGGWNNVINASRYSVIGNSSNYSYYSQNDTSFGKNHYNYSSNYTSILGGNGNTISMSNSSSIVNGGKNDITSSSNSFIAGNGNTIYGANNAFIVGRNGDIHYSNSAFATGNNNNINQTNYASILGGSGSVIRENSNFSSIIGGQNNRVTNYSQYATIVGGKNNLLTYSSSYSFIGAGSNNGITYTTHASIGGGISNNIQGYAAYASIGGGSNNNIENYSHTSFIGGGKSNLISNYSQYSFIGGGWNNKLFSYSSSILGGVNNTVIGGISNTHIIGSNIIATTSDTTYVENLNIKNIVTGVTVYNLGIDANGNVIGTTSGSTGGNMSVTNGLSISGGSAVLGGTLISPTTIDALGNDTLTINDQAGMMFQTRDALGNFFFNNIGGNGVVLGSTYYTFSYLGDGGNTFTDATITINFGGANTFKSTTDCWNFGDYNKFESTYSTFNLGRFNTLTGSSTVFLNGYNNTVYDSNNLTLIGSNNTIKNLPNNIILGNSNNNLIINGTNGVLSSLPSYSYTGNGDTNVGVLAINSSGEVYNTNVNISTLNGVRKYTTTSGFTGSVTQTINHGLSTIYISVSVWDNTTGDLIYPQVNRVDANNVNITVATTGTYDILITG